LTQFSQSTTVTFNTTEFKGDRKSALACCCAQIENQTEKSNRMTRSANQNTLIAPSHCQHGHPSALRWAI
jgi:hypothetical protein